MAWHPGERRVQLIMQLFVLKALARPAFTLKQVSVQKMFARATMVQRIQASHYSVTCMAHTVVPRVVQVFILRTIDVFPTHNVCRTNSS